MIRNGLMVALLAELPIRLRGFIGLELSRSFKRVSDRWWIVLGRRETKSGAPDERPVPEHLNRAIATYLTYARPVLLGGTEFVMGKDGEVGSTLQGALWIGAAGEPLGYSGVELAVMATTRRLLGRSLSPHDFRRNAATTARFRAGHDPNLASGLLHHSVRGITENYNLASSLEAAQRFASLVETLA